MPQPAELRPAYAWTCDHCGAENFERAVVHEFSPSEFAELNDLCVHPRTGEWMTHPERVTCQRCGREFEASDYRTD